MFGAEGHVSVRSDRRSSALQEAPFIDVVAEAGVKSMRILAVIPARNFDPLTLVVPGERFRGKRERATDTLTPMTFQDDQRRQTGEIPRSVEEWEDMDTDNAYYAGRGIVGYERRVDRAVLQCPELVGDDCR